MKHVYMDRQINSLSKVVGIKFYKLQKLKYEQNILYKSFKIDKIFLL
jgi:hypothetical protein